MMIIKCNFMGVIILSFFCAGCMAQEAPAKDTFPVVMAIENSVAYAKRDGIDWTEYSVRSAELNTNGWNSVFDRESKEPDDVSVVQKLRGKQYWEVCYGTIVPGLVGATYCYYLDRTNYKLLAAYRMK